MAIPKLILGLDPGIARTGFGLVETRPGLRLVEAGLLETPAKTPAPERLADLRQQTVSLLDRLQPDAVAVERLFFQANAKTAMQVAEARGVLMGACAEAGLAVAEYTPQQVKQSVASYGGADKAQVAAMVVRLLKLKEAPTPDDVTDGIAIALCHQQWARFPQA